MACNSRNCLDLSVKYKTRKSFDTFVVAEDGFVFKAHKLFLSEGSGYFKTFLESKLNDRNKDMEFISINLKFSKSILTSILRFIYSRKIKLFSSSVCDLAEAADFLLMDDLRMKCSNFMLKIISLDNCVSFLTTSYFLEALRINERCFRFVCVNFNNIILKCDSDITKLPFVVFHGLIKENSLRVTDEYDVWKIIVNWVESDPSTRLKDVPELLSSIRWSEISSRVKSRIAEHNIFKNNEICRDVKLEQLIRTSKNEFKQVTGRFPTKIGFFSRETHSHNTADGRITEIYITYDEEMDMYRKITETSISISDRLVVSGQFIFKFSTNKNLVTAYDLVRKKWISKRPTSIPLGYAHFVRCNNLIFAVPWNTLSVVEYYNPSTDKWIKSAPPPFLYYCAATVFRDKLCVAGLSPQGGVLLLGPVKVAEYDTASDVWSDIREPRLNRLKDFALIAFRDRLYIIGGFMFSLNNGSEPTKRVLEYRTQINDWVDFTPLPFPYSNPQAVIVKDKLIVYEKGFPSSICPPCTTWNEEKEAWDELVFPPLEFYKIGSLEDESMLKTFSKQNKDPGTNWDTSIDFDAARKCRKYFKFSPKNS